MLGCNATPIVDNVLRDGSGACAESHILLICSLPNSIFKGPSEAFSGIIIITKRCACVQHREGTGVAIGTLTLAAGTGCALVGGGGHVNGDGSGGGEAAGVCATMACASSSADS